MMNAWHKRAQRGIVWLVLLATIMLALAACERQLQPDNNNDPAPVANADAEADNVDTPAEDSDAVDAEPSPTAEDPTPVTDETTEDEAVDNIPSEDPTTESDESPRPTDDATMEATAVVEEAEEPTAEATAEPEPTAEEATTEAEPTAEGEATTEPEPTAEAEATTEPEPTADAEATPEAEATEEAEATPEAETETDPETDAATAADEESAAEAQIHTVKAGENLYRIGLLYNVSWVVLADYNDIDNVNSLVVGQEIRIPSASSGGAAAPTATPTPTTGTTYIVKAGDTLNRIGRAFNMPWTQIADANNIVNPDRIYVGQELTIPGTEPDTTPQVTHTVVRGETLYLVSLEYGVPWTTIASANNIGAPYLIYPGQTLVIPGQ